MLSEAEIIKGCKNFNRIAQKELYAKYYTKMFGVCLRYSSNPEEAKDILQDGFIKVFSNIGNFAGTGSLEGWIRRIMVNTAIKNYHKNKKIFLDIITDKTDIAAPSEEEENIEGFDLIMQAELSKEELLNALNILNPVFRIVFNMYYLENYSHKEIADMLHIDEKTSRTRLFRAKKQLQKHLYTVCEKKVGTISDFKQSI